MRNTIRSFVVILALAMIVGCSTQTKSVSSETREYPSNNTSDSTVVERRTETTSETRDESSGVLSSTVDVVGDVIAWPFRAVGGLLKGIF